MGRSRSTDKLRTCVARWRHWRSYPVLLDALAESPALGARVGAIYLGALSAVLGLLLGAAAPWMAQAGAAAGSLFAMLTFGLSAPACCFFGALGGLILGAILGSGGGVFLGASLGLVCFAAELPCGWAKPREGQVLQVPALPHLVHFLGSCLLLAPFTFGIAVPICTALGGIVGAAVDAATGLVSHTAVLLKTILSC
eukprot:Skav234703  [mRNA]  locus=scaffold3643:225952:237052:- [translate_table: standard]